MKTNPKAIKEYWKANHKYAGESMPDSGFVLDDGTVIQTFGNHDALCKPLSIDDMLRHGVVRFHLSSNKVFAIQGVHLTILQLKKLRQWIEDNEGFIAIVHFGGKTKILEPLTGNVTWKEVRKQLLRLVPVGHMVFRGKQ